MMLASAMSMSVSALEFEEPTEGTIVSPYLVNSIVPSKFLDISTKYIDQCNGAVGTACSEFYFSSGSSGRVNISSMDVSGAKPGDEITIQFVNFKTGKLIKGFSTQVKASGEIAFDKNVDLGSDVEFYTRWYINPGNKITGRYSIVQI